MLIVVDWDENFENNRSRSISNLGWVPFPNRHDGEGYTELMCGHPNGATHYAAWCLIVQIASRCKKRGTLSRDDGSPMDARAFSLKSRAPVSIFEEAIPRLISIGWLADVAMPQDGITMPDGGGVTSHCGIPGLPKGTEQKRRGRECTEPREDPPINLSMTEEDSETVLVEYRRAASTAGVVVATSKSDLEDAEAILSALPSTDDRMMVFEEALKHGAFRGPLRYIRQDLAKWWEKANLRRERAAHEQKRESLLKEAEEPRADVAKVQEMINAKLPWRRSD